jgi:hypothetical protein
MGENKPHAHVCLSDISTSRTLDRSAFKSYGQVWHMLGNVKFDNTVKMKSSPIFRGGGSAFRNITWRRHHRARLQHGRPLLVDDA